MLSELRKILGRRGEPTSVTIFTEWHAKIDAGNAFVLTQLPVTRYTFC